MAIPLHKQSSNDEPHSLAKIFELQPKAQHLWTEALCFGMANPSFDNEDIFLREFKHRIVSLVGFGAAAGTAEELRNDEAYETLYHAILDVLHCWITFQELQKTGRFRNFKPGWAAVQFKVKYGVMPRFPIKRSFYALDGGRR